MKTLAVANLLWIWVLCLPVSFSFLHIAKREGPANRGRKEQTAILRRVSLSKEPFGSSNDVSPPIPTTATFSLSSSSSSSSSLTPPKILFESDRLLVIDKPHGISHHNDQRGGDSSSATTMKEEEEEEEKEEEMGILSVMRQCQREGSISYQGRLYGVHRLDRVTSGILLLAKDPEMASILTARFRSNQIVKYYCGISSKKPTKKKQGWIQGNMVRGRRKSWYLTRQGKRTRSTKSSSNTTAVAATGAPLSMSTRKKSLEKPLNYAKTRFFTASLLSLKDQVSSSSSSWKDDDDNDIEEDQGNDATSMIPRTLLLFRPYTGKTHQLRVAAKSVGLPLLGDPVYSSSNNNNNNNKEFRTFLHAAAIHIPNVLEKDGALTLWSPPPFHHLWDDGAATSQFDTIVAKTIEKHCDCPEIRSFVLQ